MIDDSETDRALISRMLSNGRCAEWLIEECSTGRDGMRRIQEEKFDCILLDYVLPDEDGVCVLKTIRRSNLETPVVILTGNGCESVAIDAFKNGAQDYVIKGKITDQNLSEIVEQAVERKESEMSLLRRANFDSLTGLKNRTALSERIEQAIMRADRSRLPFALIYMDLNGFKSVNDMYGHDAGDILLKEIAARLVHSARCGDTVARIGGDEFVALVEGLVNDGLESGKIAARRMMQGISEKPVDVGGQLISVTASMGVALYPFMASTFEDLMKAADRAMYEAKKTGDSTIKFAENLRWHDKAS